MTTYDRVKVNTATTGAGSVVVGTAYQSQWQSFSDASVADAAALILLIEDGYVNGVPTTWEISTSVYTLATTTATRVLRSSKTGSLLNLSGSATVAIIGVAADEINQLPYKNTANTFTATQAITPAANTEALTISGGSVTGSGAASFASITGTWNTSGTPNALKVNITDTASAALSRLAAFQVGSADRVILLKSGRVAVAQTYQVGTPQYTHTTDLTSGMSVSSNGVFFHAAGASSAAFSTGGLAISGTLVFGWAPAGADSAAADTMMSRKATAIIHHGAADAASPIAQTLGAQGSRGGTDSNVAGANLTIRSGIGTGNATGSSLILQTPAAGASGTTSQTSTTRLTLGPTAAVYTYPYRSQAYTVATLPAGTQGDRAHVTDALAPAFLTAVVGGGAAVTPVFYDGTNWVAG